jgi:hypothetical protein
LRLWWSHEGTEAQRKVDLLKTYNY